MRLPRPQITVRWLTVAVAIVGGILGLVLMAERYISKGMVDFYGPGGVLERQNSPPDRLPIATDLPKSE